MAETNGSASPGNGAASMGVCNRTLHPMGIQMRILETRCHPPLQDPVALIPRHGVAEILSGFGDRRIVLIRAPAGYGKTTSLVQLHRRALDISNSVAWISLDDFDGSWTEIAYHLMHALAVCCGRSAVLAAGKGLSADDAIAKLCDTVRSLPDPVFVILDDFHAVHGTAAEQFVGRLIKHTANTVQWAIGTRVCPSFGLARYRSAGRLVEISADELRFSSDEALRMLSLSAGRVAPAHLAEIAHLRTEGWPAGLKLVSIALSQSTDEKALFDRLSGENRDVSSFFYEEVLARLDADLQSFLLHTSVLGRFCPELCDSLTGRSDGRKMVQELESMGLFIFSLDGVQQWYRYHHLFADFLLRLLREREPGLERTLHGRASDWFGRNGLMAESIQHALRGDDPRRAAVLLDGSWESLNERGVFSTAVRWAASIPACVLDDFPGIQLWRAWYLMCERRFDEAHRLLQGVSAKLDVDSASGIEKPEHMQWRQSLLHRKLMFAQYSDDVHTAEQLSRSLPTQPGSFDSFLQTTIEIATIYIQREQYELRQIEALNARAHALGRASGKESVLIWLACAAGPAFVLQGKADAAIEIYRDASRLANQIECDSNDFRTMPALLWAGLLVERGEFEEAKKLFQQASRMGNGVGYVDQLIAFHVMQSRMAHYEAETGVARTLLRQGFALAVEKGLDRLRWSVVQERIRQALADGDLAAARQAAAEAGLPTSPDSLRPRGLLTTRLEWMAAAWLQLAIAIGRPSDAISLTRQWIGFAVSHGAVATQVRFSLLLTRALHAAGESRAALRALHEGMAAAAGPQFILGFIESGEPIQSLLRKALQAESANGRMADFASRLASVFASSPGATAGTPPEAVGHLLDAAAPCEPLSPREVQILRHASRSLLNKEIADRLGMTEGSVKWYMQQIFGKLGVRRRVAALDKARSLGYLQ